MNINDVMLNPIRMRIVQTLVTHKHMTTNEICEEIKDVPRTTLYRHINILIEAAVLTIVEEKKVRGSYERTLALNSNELSKHNTLENAAQNVLAFFMSKYSSFYSYFNGANPDPAKDRLFYNNTILMASDKEFDDFLRELRELLVKYSFEYAEGRKTRDISVVSASSESK